MSKWPPKLGVVFLDHPDNNTHLANAKSESTEILDLSHFCTASDLFRVIESDNNNRTLCIWRSLCKIGGFVLGRGT